MDFTSNYFEIFSLPVGYQLDRGTLDASYRTLQQTVHPDRFASGSDVEKRRAVQTAALINQAYTTLTSPLRRAQYLLELAGVDDSQQQSHVTSDGAFLMQQMMLRERLGEAAEQADPFAELESLRNETEAQMGQLQSQFESLYNDRDLPAAYDAVVKMQFFTKLGAEIDQLEQDLEE